MKIAVIGSGISGNAAAWALSKNHDVTVYERRDRPGGHSATVDIDYDGTRIPVDTGFIVYNEHNYPDLTALFRHLDVSTEASNMGFAVSAPAARLEWSGNDLSSIFAQRRNIVRPEFLWMLREILRFNRQCVIDRDKGLLAGISLGQYLALRGYSNAMQQYYLVPMGAAIWSTSPREMLEFPAASFVDFFDNHRLLHRERPAWRTVTGGSREYVAKLTSPFASGMRLGAVITAIERREGGAIVHESCGRSDRYDQVIIATHSDQALRLLADPSEAESRILGDIRYKPNQVFLHRDASLMPKRKSVWSSWNYMCPVRSPDHSDDGDKSVSVSYWMNALQNIDRTKPVFISLNPERPPRPELTFGEYEYDHPQFDAGALAAQRRLAMIQGERSTWYCGAYHGHGFHEDGLRSGLTVAERLGAEIPWRQPQRIMESPLMAAARLRRIMTTPAPTQPETPPASSLYFGEVMHERFKPFSHRFTYRVFSAFLDIDRIDDLASSTRLFSRNRFNLYSFYDRDHGPRDGSSLRLHVERLLKEAGQTFQPAEIRLLCYPRILGHVFNPLSVYYCYDHDGEIGALIYEVRNTFAEHHSYVAPIMRDEAGHTGIRQSRDKLFYVSPFIDMTARYNFTLRKPGQRLHVLIRETADGSDLLLATFKGTRHDLNGRNLMIAAVKFPLMTLKVVAAINFEALRLWLKGAKLFSRPAAPNPPVSFSQDSKPGRDEKDCAHAAQ